MTSNEYSIVNDYLGVNLLKRGRIRLGLLEQIKHIDLSKLKECPACGSQADIAFDVVSSVNFANVILAYLIIKCTNWNCGIRIKRGLAIQVEEGYDYSYAIQYEYLKAKEIWNNRECVTISKEISNIEMKLNE